MFTPSFISELFPDLPESFPLDALPEPMRGMVDGISQKFSIPPENSFAICATALAGCAGHKLQVDDWKTRAMPLLSYYVLIGDSNPQIDDAIELALRPLLLVSRFLRENSEHAKNTSDEDLNYPVDGIAAFEASQRLRQALLKPTITLHSATASRLSQALGNSFDKSLVLLPGKDDAAHWLSLPGTDRTALARVLGNSWDTSLTGSFHLNLLWKCSHESSYRFGNCKQLRDNPVPFFYILMGPRKPLTDAAAANIKAQSQWEKCLDVLLKIRLHNPLEVYQFNPEGVKCMTGFINDFNMRLERISAELRPFVRWLPVAVRRFSLMHTLLEASKNDIGPESVTSAIRVMNWMGAAHLNAIITAIPLRHVKEARRHQITADERMLEKVRLKEPVLWSDLRRSYPNSKAEPLLVIRDRLIAEGSLQWDGSRLKLGQPAPKGSAS